MELEVGMYVKTKDGTIGKLMGHYAYDENKVAIWTANKGDIQITPVIDKSTIIKASHNILDLIEVGDYVNGLRVHGITDYGLEVYMFGDAHEILEENEIKSIVTKGQFESMSYKVGE